MADNNKSYTPIQEFYGGQSIFITGGTGFLGKVLIEKLLRSCPDIRTIYLPIRPKKNKNVQERLDDMFQIPLYSRIKEEMPHFRNKVVPVTNINNYDGLEISEKDMDLLINKVSIIFHLAATVRFDEKFEIAASINVGITKYILDMCKRMPNLKACVYVSTFYSNCHVKHIEERFYEYPIDYKNFIALKNMFPADIMDGIIKRFTLPWPNTYTCTKAMAEALVKDQSGDLPIGILRPAISN